MYESDIELRDKKFDLARKLAADETKASASGFRRVVSDSLRAWFTSRGGSQDVWDDDRKMMLWLTENSKAFSTFIDTEKGKSVAQNVSEMIAGSSNEELTLVMSALSKEDRAKILAALK